MFRALCAGVASGKVDPRAAWPEFFAVERGDDEAFPATDADMSGFEWEHPTAEQAGAELEMMMRGARVTVRDTSAPPTAPPVIAMPPPAREPEAALRPMPGRRPQPQDASALEWS